MLTPEESAAIVTADINQTLSNFRNYTLGLSNVTTPLKLLIVQGRSEYNRTLGVAYIGGACIPSYGAAVAVNQGEIRTARVLAHEIGHTLGLNHDDQQPNCNVPNTSSNGVMAQILQPFH